MSAATLVRNSRKSAGLTQEQLARRAGTSQPAIARYEQGTTEPRADTLLRLLAACGETLETAPAEVHETHVPARGPIGRRVRKHLAEVGAEARKVGARRVIVFGSTARGEDTSRSDLDLFIEMPASSSVLAVYDIQAALEQLLKVEVDVLDQRVAKPEILEAVSREGIEL